jgi:hypothetical protein
MNFVQWHRTEVSGQLYSQEGIAIAHWIGGWVGTGADLVVIMLREVLVPAGNCTLFMWPIAELLYSLKCQIYTMGHFSVGKAVTV